MSPGTHPGCGSFPPTGSRTSHRRPARVRARVDSLNSMNAPHVPLSILDLVSISEGQSTRDAIAASLGDRVDLVLDAGPTSRGRATATVDVGAAQLAMHSARELMGADDVSAYSAALQAFLSPG